MNTERGKEIRCNSGPVFKVCTVCKNKRESFKVAPYFVCAYFSLETDRVRRVCNKCYDEAENHQSVLVNMLTDCKSIFSGPKKPKNTVEVVDLDDEDDSDSHEEPDQCQEEVEIEDDVDNIVACAMEKYRFREQLDAASLHLRNYNIFNLFA
jgi:histone-lysine N-methyltransferase SETDB1